MKTSARTILLVLGDVAMMLLSFFLMIKIAFYPEISPKVLNEHLQAFVFVFLIWLLVFFLFNLYDTRSIKPTIPLLSKIGVAYLIALTTSIILFYIIPALGITPKTNLMIFSLLFLFLFIAWRRIFYNFFASNFKKGVAFIAELNSSNEIQVQEIVNYIETYPHSGFYVVGIYNSPREFQEREKTQPVDTLIIAKNSFKESKDLANVYNSIENIIDLNYAYEDILGKIPVDSIDEAWFIHNVHTKDTIYYNFIVNIINKIIASAILILTSPVLIIVAIIIKINDGGPILYTQLRVGEKGKNFRLYKFRSMIVDSEKNGAVWANKNDARVTSIGKIIRKTHIDEIPQMINILNGELSLVGPRPERPEFVEKLEHTIPHYELRHIIRPGFTGWAQIKYRYANTIEDSKEKFKYDLYYIKNRNLFLDFGIILRTIQIIFTH